MPCQCPGGEAALSGPRAELASAYDQSSYPRSPGRFRLRRRRNSLMRESAAHAQQTAAVHRKRGPGRSLQGGALRDRRIRHRATSRTRTQLCDEGMRAFVPMLGVQTARQPRLWHHEQILFSRESAALPGAGCSRTRNSRQPERRKLGAGAQLCLHARKRRLSSFSAPSR